MTHVLLLNLVLFMPATAGAAVFAVVVYRLLRVDAPEADEPGPGTKRLAPSSPRSGGWAGPDDLARSA